MKIIHLGDFQRGVAFDFYSALEAYTTGDAQGSATIASGDWTISKDGGTFANLATLPVVTPAATKQVKVAVSATEADCAFINILGVDQTTEKEWEDVCYTAKLTAATEADRSILLVTTIATLASQTSFTLTDGSADNSAYLGAPMIITDATTTLQKAVGLPSAYTGATKTITLQEDPGIFTMAVGDKVTILKPAVELFKKQVDGTRTFEQSVRLQNSGAGAKLSGAATTNVLVRDLADTKNRIDATVDADGNRSAVTLDLT